MYFKNQLGSLLLFLLQLGVANLLAAEGPTNPGTPPRKVVRSYALTSANDFQQRDPLDWRLLASNDGGKTWTTLDRRSAEVFSERHQRRVFLLSNTNAYNLYRLQVDRVREPKAANCVQLAELEVMGEAAGDFTPMPIFADRITAQGDNPPLETVAQLFDGKVETKWLDRPVARDTCASWIQWQYSAPASVTITNISQLLALGARADACYAVRFDAVLGGCAPGSNGVEVLDDTGVVDLRSSPGLEQGVPGQRVFVEGVSEWRGRSVGLERCRIQLRGAAATNLPVRISLDQAFPPKADNVWVELEGQLQFRQVIGDELSFELNEGERSLPVRMRRSEAAEALVEDGQWVRVRGVCRGGYDERGIWVAANLWAAGTATVMALERIPEGSVSLGRDAARPVEPRVAGVIKIVDIRKMDREQLRRRPPVKIRGVMTSLLGAFVQDDTAAIQVALKPEDNRRLKALGQYVELEGWLGLSDAATPILSADRVVLLGPGTPPKPQRPQWGELASGHMDAVWVELEGVVRATDGAHLLMNSDGRQVTASLAAAAAPVVNRLVDASVRARGVAVASLDDWGRMQGVHLLIPSLEYLHVESSPPEPFSQPIQPIRSLLQAGGAGASSHRVRVEGVLTMQDGQRLFLQDASGGAMAIFKQEVVLDSIFGRSQWSFWRTPTTPRSPAEAMTFSPGDRVEVVGFQDTHGYSPVLTEVLARKTGGQGTTKAEPITTNSFSDWRLDSRLVKLEGVLVGQQLLGEHRVLELLSHGRTLQAFLPSGVALTENLQPGTTLDVTGVWQMDPVPYAELGRRVGAVRILTRSPADLLVLARPSWWTVRRALTVIGGMAFVLLAASVWITQLHRKVEQRSVQLSAEIHRREQMEHQRALEEERSRIARDLHDDLGAALTQIRFLSAVESRDQAVPEGTRHRLGQVSDKSHQLVTSLDEIVWAINPANDSLPSLVNYLCHVAAEFFATTPIRCRLDVDDALPAVALTSEMRHNLYLAVREALNNIAKHSEATEAWLRIHWNNGTLELAVEDNGRGYSQAQAAGAGEGLRNMRQRIEQIGGQFHSDSRAGAGTVCRIALELRGRDGDRSDG